MPGVIPLEDAQDMYTSRLQDHANGLFQQAEAINQPPLQNVSPEAIPADAVQAAQSAAASLQQHAQTLFAQPPEPAAVDDATQSLQQHAQSLFDAAQSANQPPLQGVDPVAAVLGAAEQAGADMSQFAQTLSQHLQTAGGDVTSAALGAAEQSGANMTAFTGALNAALPQPSSAATPTPTTPAGGTTADTGPTTVGQGRSDFIQSLKPLADSVAQKYGLDGNTLLAIAANETGWGQSSNAQQQNNLFSIQGDGSNGSRWASYKSPQESFDAFVNLISGAPRYRQAWADRTDPAKFVDDLRQAGYVADEPGFPAQGWVDQVNAIQRNLPQAAGAAASALGSAAQGAVQGVQDAAQQGLQAVNTTAQAAQAAFSRAQPVEAQRQFEQEAGLSAGDAYTACGPVAAAAFAKTYGRNPTPSEAIELARQVGWNPNTGMAGVGSEVQLLKAMGIDAHATAGVDWANVGRDASAGNPVIIDTPGHYYYVDGYNQQTGEFHVGASGLALRGGSEWMTPDQINRMPQSGGAARAAVFSDHPLSGPGIASQVAETTGNVASAISQKAQDVTQAVQQVGQDVGRAADTVGGVVQDVAARAQRGGQAAADVLEQQRQQLIQPTNSDPVQQSIQNARAFQNGDWAALAEGTMNMLPAVSRAGASADLSPSVSAGLTAAGVDPNVARVLGQVANVAGQVGLERALPGAMRAAGRGAGAVLNSAFEAMDRVMPPQVAFAQTLSSAERDAVEQLLSEARSTLSAGGIAPDLEQQLRSHMDALQQRLISETASKAGETGGLTQEAQQVLQVADRGGVPTVVTSNLRRIATDNGVTITSDMTPNDVIEALRARAPAAETPAAPQGYPSYPAPPPAPSPVPPPAPVAPTEDPGASAALLQSLHDQASSRGADPAALDALQQQIDAMRSPDAVTGAGTGARPGAERAGPGPGPATPPPTAPPPPTPPAAASAGPGVTVPGVSRIGQLIASAMGPTENLPPQVRAPIVQFANMVGKQSDAASVMAHSSHLLSGGLDDAGDSIRQTLRSDATQQLIRDLQAQRLAVPVGDAPAGWRTVTDVPQSPLSNYAFDPSVVGPIKAVIDRSAIAGNPLGSSILNAVGTAKSTLFSLSNFHTITEGLNAGFSSRQTLKNYARAFLSDSFTQAARGQMSDTFDAAAQAGVTGLSGAGRASADVPGQLGNAVWRRAIAGTVGGVGGAASGYTEAKIGGKSDEEARQQALIGGAAGVALGAVPLGGRGTVPEILQSSLWERAVPIAKATAWDALTKGGLAPDVAAKVVNERFGGLNYAAMGRNPTLMDATRLLVQAPDWTESTVRQLGSAMFGGSGQGVRAGFLAKAIAGTLAVTEVANYAFSGHSTLQNQPGHQFEIEVRDPSGGFMHIGLLPGNVQSFLNEGNKLTSDDSAKRAQDLTTFVTGRMSEPARLASEAAQTATAGGSSLRTPYAVGKAGPVAGLLSTLAPVGISQVQQGVEEGGVDPKLATAMAAAGLNPRYTSAAAAQRAGFTAPGTTRPRTAPPVAPRNVAPVQRLKK